jgi:threonine dehydrogenase-like Zn-dependent dehydrogenase
VAEHVRAITGGGADHAFEAIGRATTIEALPSLVGRGGQAVIVGMPAEGVTVSLDPFDLADAGKRVLGCNYGSSVPSVDFPRLARLYASGRLPLDRLVERRRRVLVGHRDIPDRWDYRGRTSASCPLFGQVVVDRYVVGVGGQVDAKQGDQGD